jgi:hypothetical protein
MAKLPASEDCHRLVEVQRREVTVPPAQTREALIAGAGDHGHTVVAVQSGLDH